MFQPGPDVVDPLVDVWVALAAEWADDPADAPDTPTTDAAEGLTGGVWGLLGSDPDAFVASVLAAGPGPAAGVALGLVDPGRLSGAGRLDLLTGWAAQTAWAEAHGAATLVAHVGDRRVTPTRANQDAGYLQRSRLHEAGLALNVSTSAATDRWHTAATLATRLPQTCRALARGRLSWWHAHNVVAALPVHPDDPAIRPDADDPVTAAVDALAAEHGPGLTPPRLRRRCRALVDRLLPDAAEARITAAHTNRRVERFGDDAGQACLALWGSPLDVQAMWLVIDRLAGPSDADDPRSLANRRFDATLGALLGADPKLRPSAELTDDGVAATPAPRVNPDPQL